MKIRLEKLDRCVIPELYDMYQDIPKREPGSHNILNGVDYKEFERICNELIKEENLINEELNTTTNRYILYDDNKPIGEAGIRTTKSEFWVNSGSQIYYKIRTSERGKGYGNIILALALKEAKKLGFKKIRVNCDDNNIASKKIILKHNGVIDIKNYKTKDGTSSSYVIKLD